MLLIRINDADIDLMLWKWTEADFKVPLRMKFADLEASIVLEDPNKIFSVSKLNNPRQWVHCATVIFQFNNPSLDFTQGLAKPNSQRGADAAKKIHQDYLRCVDTLMTYVRLVLNVHSVSGIGRSSARDLFGGGFSGRTKVSWSLDGDSFMPFKYTVKGRRKINPIYKSESLIWPSDWQRLQKTIIKGIVVCPEVEELLKLRSKILWNEKRVSIVESTALVEMTLKNVVNSVLMKRGLSKNRLASLNEEAGLSIFLNFMLPLCVTQSLYKRALPLIQNIDKLRKIRNEIMHENLPESAIDRDEAYKGVNSCIALITLLIKDRKFVPPSNSS
jgi:uncharacterized protein YajQ (UPF0234 family)